MKIKFNKTLLTELNLRNCNITYINPDQFKSYNFTNLKTLVLCQNNLSD